MVAPIGLALLLGDPKAALTPAVGALCAAFADQGGALRLRVSRGLTASVLASVGFAVGASAQVLGPLPGGVAVVVVAALSALLPALGGVFVVGGYQLLIVTVLASGVGGAVPPLRGAPLVLLGGLFAVLVSIVVALLGGQRPGVRGGLLFALDAMAAALREPAGVRTGAMNTAFQQVEQHVPAATRSWAGTSTTGAARRLLSASQDAQTAVGALAATGVAAPDLADAVEQLAALVRSSARDGSGVVLPPRAASGVGPTSRSARSTARLRVEVGRGIETMVHAWSAPGAASPGDARDAGRGSSSRSAFPPVAGVDRAMALFAVRLGSTIAVAELLQSALPLSHSYWTALTVALILRPDFGSVFARSVQRILGTVLGVLLAGAVLVVVPAPLLLLPLAVLIAVCPLAFATSYGLFSAVITPVLLGLIDLGGQNGLALLGPRLADTLLGAAMVLVVGYACWPPVWRPHPQQQVAQIAEATAELARRAFTSAPDPDAVLDARREVYRRIRRVETALAAQAAEPPPSSTTALGWRPFVTDLRRAADQVVILAAQQHASSPIRQHLDRSSALFDRLAGVIQHTPSRRSSAAPRAGVDQLADIREHLRTADDR